MGTKRRAAREVVQDRGRGEFWIDHAAITDADERWLQDATWLTLWNVTVPDRFLARLPRLAGLDLRGGSAADLRVVEGCAGLRGLVVNQVRGLADVSAVCGLSNLEILSFYGVKQVTSAPSLAGLGALRRLELGQMGGLPRLGRFLDAPGIEDLQLLEWVTVTADDVRRLKSHPTLKYFGWWAVDVPEKRWLPVLEAVGLPPGQAVHPHDWLRARGSLP